MNLVHPTGLLAAEADAPAPDLFDAPTYAEFVRAAMRIKARGADVSMLFESTMAEPVEALADVVRSAVTPRMSSRYVSVFADGNRYAVEALARRYGLQPDQFITATGCTGAISLILKALVPPGSRVLVEQPGFDMLAKLAAEAGAWVTPLPRTGPDFRVALERLPDLVTPDTAAVLLTSLHNPSGAPLADADLRAVADAAAQVGAIVIVDEVYADFADPAPAPACSLAPNVLTVSSLTKVFGLFALKFGWIAGSAELVTRVRTGASDGDLGVSKLAHAVAAHVLEEPGPFETHWRSILTQTRPIVEAASDQLIRDGLLSGTLPAHGCMYFPKVVGCADTRGLARRLFAEHRVLVAPGEFFGAPGFIRLGFGSEPDALREGFARLRAGLAAQA